MTSCLHYRHIVRKRNIIIYRVPDKRMENVTEQKASDTVFFKDFLDGVFNSKLEHQNIERIYKKVPFDPFLLYFVKVVSLQQISLHMHTGVAYFGGKPIQHVVLFSE